MIYIKTKHAKLIIEDSKMSNISNWEVADNLVYNSKEKKDQRNRTITMNNAMIRVEMVDGVHKAINRDNEATVNEAAALANLLNKFNASSIAELAQMIENR